MTVGAFSVLTPRLPVDVSINSKARNDSLEFFFLKIIALFTYLWLHWVFIAALGLPLVVGSRGYSSCSAPASHCGGSSCCRASQALEHGLSSCGTRGLHCLEACGIFPDQGLNPCLVHCQAHS